jgi:hypothetical protein
MTIQDLGALGELLGSVAVLVTLIYLALQTRQNTMAIGAQLDGARVTSTMSLSLAAVTSNELQDALNEDLVDAPPISQARRAQFWFALLVNFQWQLYQARRGLLPSTNEATLRRGIRLHFNSYRSFESWWEGSRAQYSPEFVEWVEEQRAKAAYPGTPTRDALPSS